MHGQSRWGSGPKPLGTHRTEQELASGFSGSGAETNRGWDDHSTIGRVGAVIRLLLLKITAFPLQAFYYYHFARFYPLKSLVR
jgi:hypothetical protein